MSQAATELELFRQYRRGHSIESLARDAGKSRASVSRTIRQMRANALAELNLDYIDSDEFHQPAAGKRILGPPPERKQKVKLAKPPQGIPPYLASLYSIPLLTAAEEAYYFRKMNFLKYRASCLRDKLSHSNPIGRDLDTIEALVAQISEVKNFLIRSNLRLVVSIAKKYLRPTSNLFELVSDGNMALIRAIEKFDYAKGNKFSTYASWAIIRNFSRSIPAEQTRRHRFRTGNNDVFLGSSDERSNPFLEEIVNQRQRKAIRRLLENLDNREKEVIVARFGLDQQSEPATLQEVGERFGVTKERIRQLQFRALRKMRRFAKKAHMDIPDQEFSIV